MNKWRCLEEEDRLFYTIEDLATILGIAVPSARVTASRKSAAGDLLRVRRNLYVLPQRFRHSSRADLFKLANIIQTPSYVSFLTALSHYQLSTQLVSSVVESVNPVRARTFQAGSVTFRYFFCRQAYFFGFVKEKGIFVAEPEKALLDTLYFQFFRKYAVDEVALDLKEFAWKKIEKWARIYPGSFRSYLGQWRKKWKI